MSASALESRSPFRLTCVCVALMSPTQSATRPASMATSIPSTSVSILKARDHLLRRASSPKNSWLQPLRVAARSPIHAKSSRAGAYQGRSDHRPAPNAVPRERRLQVGPEPSDPRETELAGSKFPQEPRLAVGPSLRLSGQTGAAADSRNELHARATRNPSSVAAPEGGTRNRSTPNPDCRHRLRLDNRDHSG